ncbi:hypothetical protein ACLOJK_017776 [Asimina triloba]
MSSEGHRQIGSGSNAAAAAGDKSKKMAVMGLSSLILVAMVVAVAVGVSKNGAAAVPSGGDHSEPTIKTSSKAVTAICQPTDYKQTCIKSLTEVGGNETNDPKELVRLAFEVASKKVKKALNMSDVLKKAEKDPMAKKALDNCKQLMHYSIDDLHTSLSKLGEFDVSRLDEFIDDIKMWLSGSLTYQETCVDGFDGVKTDAGEKMKEALQAASQLTSNVLAIVDELSSIVLNLDLSFLNRRLLNTEAEAVATGAPPSWVTPERRHMLSLSANNLKPDVIVAKDGSGQFKTINEALSTIPKKGKTPYVIYIKAGVYAEQVTIDKSMTHVVMIGDGQTKTKITGSKNFIDGTPTFNTATVGMLTAIAGYHRYIIPAVIGDSFMAKDIGFENSAGAAKHQAVALRVQSEKSIFYRCQMDGYQDTLYVHTHRQFYRECTISGTIDFIFGNSAVVFQNCKMVVRKPMDNQQNIVTAQGRKDRREPTAIIIHNCSVVADPALAPVRQKIRSYLGRPWKMYSRTFYIQSEIGDLIQPDGWLPWGGDFGLATCFYAEYDNRGAGADTSKRVTWKGIKSLTPERAKKFTVSNFIAGNSWLTPAGVPFMPGLLSSS